MRYFCTYFDSAYLPRGMAMYNSLRRHCPAFTLWVLCLDQLTFDWLAREKPAGIALLSLSELENANQSLAKARSNRSRIEYYFTCSPALPLYILEGNVFVETITYLDSDLYFYSSPERLFLELGSASVGIISHRVTREMAKVEEYGVYNVGWVSFRRDETGLECLRWWAERCLEWCYHRVEGDRYADQKYLDQFPKKFRNVAILKNEGANVGPWNVANYTVRWENETITVNHQPLIFFHFQGFFQVTRNSYETGLGVYYARLKRSALRMIFEPYIQTLRTFSPRGIDEGLVYKINRGGPSWKKLLRPIRHLPTTLAKHMRGERIFYVRGRVV